MKDDIRKRLFIGWITTENFYGQLTTFIYWEKPEKGIMSFVYHREPYTYLATRQLFLSDQNKLYPCMIAFFDIKEAANTDIGLTLDIDERVIKVHPTHPTPETNMIIETPGKVKEKLNQKKTKWLNIKVLI